MDINNWINNIESKHFSLTLDKNKLFELIDDLMDKKPSYINKENALSIITDKIDNDIRLRLIQYYLLYPINRRD